MEEQKEERGGLKEVKSTIHPVCWLTNPAGLNLEKWRGCKARKGEPGAQATLRRGNLQLSPKSFPMGRRTRELIKPVVAISAPAEC